MSFARAFEPGFTRNLCVESFRFLAVWSRQLGIDHGPPEQLKRTFCQDGLCYYAKRTIVAPHSRQNDAPKERRRSQTVTDWLSGCELVVPARQ